MEWNAVYLFLAVAFGGAIGATLRYAVYRTVDTQFPWATFIVNIIGCTLAAFIMFRFSGNMDELSRTMIFVGIFGAFTTMSTFSIDTVKLFIGEEYMSAVCNVFMNAIICVAGAFAGRWLALLQ